MDYAIEEVWRLLGRAGSGELDDAVIRYVCALFAELAYHHIPKLELDSQAGRAKLVPSFAYQELVARGRPTDVVALLPQTADIPAFAVFTDAVVAVGAPIREQWFIGFRGTKVLYGFDWSVNARVRHVRVSSLVDPSRRGRYHAGFAREAERISRLIAERVEALELPTPDRVYLTGHSLGGAVAAISREFLRYGHTDVCLFGAPRHADREAYAHSPDPPPLQVRRAGDQVPTVPSRRLGYADPPLAIFPDASPFRPSGKLGALTGWPRFVAGRFHQHFMDHYRQDVGRVAGADFWDRPLTDFERL